MTRISLVLAGVAGAAVVSAALVGCGGGTSDGVAAQVGSQSVSQAELDYTLSQQKAQMEQSKQTFPEVGSDAYNTLASQALQGLVFQRIVDQEAQECGKPCTVPAATVAKDLKKIVKQNFSGDQKQFNDFLKKAGLTRADAERIVRVNLEQPKLVARATKNVKVSRAEALAACKKNPNQFDTPASRAASHILVKTKAEADRIRAMATSSNFAALAAQYSTDPGSKDQGGSLGAITKGTLVPAFEKVAYALKDGEISQPVHTQFGWHIITVQLTPAQHQTCEQAIGKAMTQQVQLKKATAEQTWRTNLEKKWAARITYADESLKPATTTG